MTWKSSRFLKYGVAALVLVLMLAFSVVPIASSLVEQWSRQDVQLRSRLVYNSIQGPIIRALSDGEPMRLANILQGVAEDERILAVGLCDELGRLQGATKLMPQTFSCDKVAKSEGESYSDIINDGRRVLIGSFPITTRDARDFLVVLHDLSFVDARSRQAQTYAVAALFGLAVLLGATAVVVVIVILRRWMRSLREAIDDIRFGAVTDAAHRPRTSTGLQIEALLKDLTGGRATPDIDGIEWSPKSLHSLIGGPLAGTQVIIISNREPYIHNKAEHGIALQTPASGLVAALEPVMRACGGTWIAHGSGTADKETVDENDKLDVPPSAPAYSLRRVWINEAEQDGYYYGLANEGLWPLCHIAFVKPIFRESDWKFYREINERFAEAVVREARSEDPIVLVQDYHFALAPRMIHERLPKATIITFWHIPWPNPETFGICPWKEQILEGLLGSSILGFHTQFHCNNFIDTVDRFIESRIDREHATVTLRGHVTMIRAYPISIEWPPKALEAQPSVSASRERVRQMLELPSDTRLGLGIERFDYTKGILDRMHAIDRLLGMHPEWRRAFTFVQVAAPTRSKLASYRNLQSEAIALADELNSRHGEVGYKPIRLLIRHHEPREVFELFRAADVCVVSSLHDGMNLVAKEFVAARDDESGVLVLSSFTGASREMSEALIVNPYDEEEMAEALHQALKMPRQEQQERMRLMRQQVRKQNVYRWAGRMLLDAIQIRERRRILELADAK